MPKATKIDILAFAMDQPTPSPSSRHQSEGPPSQPAPENHALDDKTASVQPVPLFIQQGILCFQRPLLKCALKEQALATFKYAFHVHTLSLQATF